MYVSILHADPSSPYPYFSGKGEVERHLAASGVPYAIARPAILFGESADRGAEASILLNNIAWLLRHLPAFAIGGGGGYKIRPIHVDDLARLCVGLAARPDDVTVDAVGPESVTFKEMVMAIRAATGSRSRRGARAWLADPARLRGPGRAAARCPAHRRGVPGDGGRPGRFRRARDRAGSA